MSRFIRFNVVGALGLGVQLVALAALDHAGWALVPATVAAVEVAVLHNFLWHERWTWADRRGGSRVDRLGRFHASDGLLSLLGNATLTWCFAAPRLPIALANLAAVGSVVRRRDFRGQRPSGIRTRAMRPGRIAAQLEHLDRAVVPFFSYRFREIGPRGWLTGRPPPALRSSFAARGLITSRIST